MQIYRIQSYIDKNIISWKWKDLEESKVVIRPKRDLSKKENNKDHSRKTNPIKSKPSIKDLAILRIVVQIRTNPNHVS